MSNPPPKVLTTPKAEDILDVLIYGHSWCYQWEWLKKALKKNTKGALLKKFTAPINPVSFNGILKESTIYIETLKEKLEMNLQVIFFVPILSGEESKKEAMKMLIEFDTGNSHSCGFFWYGKSQY